MPTPPSGEWEQPKHDIWKGQKEEEIIRSCRIGWQGHRRYYGIQNDIGLAQSEATQAWGKITMRKGRLLKDRPAPGRKICVLISALLVVGGMDSASAVERQEAEAVIERLLALPKVEAAPGFTVSVLVPPGALYDPLWPHAHGDAVWLNDDGGEEDEKGSRILALDEAGALSVLIGLGRLLPATGFDVAPPGFGDHAGHIFTLAQARVAAPGAVANHVIQRIDPASKAPAETVCTLTPAGSANEGVSGFGVDARFGPPDSPFAGSFYAATAYNNTIYRVTADGSCAPFVTLSGWAAPAGIAFTADRQSMLVSVTRGGLLEPPQKGEGAILRVHPNGQVDEMPVVTGLTRPIGLAIAPEDFAGHGGELFIADAGDLEIPVPMTQQLGADGVLYRAGADGTPHPVATGLINPMGIAFIGAALWVTDINGDFIAGKRELPDGFVLRLTPERAR